MAALAEFCVQDCGTFVCYFSMRKNRSERKVYDGSNQRAHAFSLNLALLLCRTSVHKAQSSKSSLDLYAGLGEEEGACTVAQYWVKRKVRALLHEIGCPFGVAVIYI